MNFDVANLDVWDGALSPVVSPTVQGWVSLSFAMGFAAHITAVVVDRDIQYAGRCQVGEDLWLAVQSIGLTRKSSAVARSDAAPVVRVYAESGGRPVRTLVLPIDHSSGGSRGVFRGPFRPGGPDVPGHYWAVVLYLVGGLLREAIAAFDVVPGGHRNGAIMTTFHFVQPAGGSFLAHHEAGTVTSGLRPYLDRGD
jgi:hypothetical protein